MTRTESTVCWLGWAILALVGMYGCAGGGTALHHRASVSPAVEARQQAILMDRRLDEEDADARPGVAATLARAPVGTMERLAATASQSNLAIE